MGFSSAWRVYAGRGEGSINRRVEGARSRLVAAAESFEAAMEAIAIEAGRDVPAVGIKWLSAMRATKGPESGESDQ
jgi:hypothetical protein